MKLNPEKIQEIEVQASTVLEDVYQGKEILPPIQIVDVLKKFGLTLKSGEFDNKNVLGAFDRATNTIYVSSDDSPRRQLFTAAHELGHFLLHKEKQREMFYRTQIIQLEDQDAIEETEANWFAASLLMPKQVFTLFWNFIHDEEKLALLFRVSATAVHWRAKNLGLVEG